MGINSHNESWQMTIKWSEKKSRWEKSKFRINSKLIFESGKKNPIREWRAIEIERENCIQFRFQFSLCGVQCDVRESQFLWLNSVCVRGCFCFGRVNSRFRSLCIARLLCCLRCSYTHIENVAAMHKVLCCVFNVRCCMYICCPCSQARRIQLAIECGGRSRHRRRCRRCRRRHKQAYSIIIAWLVYRVLSHFPFSYRITFGRVGRALEERTRHHNHTHEYYFFNGNRKFAVFEISIVCRFVI